MKMESLKVSNLSSIFYNQENHFSISIFSKRFLLKRKRISFYSCKISKIEILKKIKSDNECYILSNSEKYIEPRTYRKYFNKVLKENKIKHFNFHSLRHTFATNCITLGCDYKTVSELFGHANVNITLNLYVHPRYSQKKKCIDLVSKIFQEKANK